MIHLEHFGTGELDPVQLAKTDPEALERLEMHVLWEVTYKLDDCLQRAQPDFAAYRTLVYGADL